MTLRRIGYSVAILFMLALDAILIYLVDVIKNDTGVHSINAESIGYVSLLAILGSFIIIGMNIFELFKSEEKVKAENRKLIENQIKYHEKVISEFKEDLKKYE